MAFQIQQSDCFPADVEAQFRWYLEAGGAELAMRYVTAVEATLAKLLKQPETGRLRFPNDTKLQGIRSCLVIKPFDRHLIFYRIEGDCIILVRTIHGARDLPKCLKESRTEQ